MEVVHPLTGDRIFAYVYMQQMELVHPVTGDRMQQVHTPKQTQGNELSFVITLAEKHQQASENCVQTHEGSSCHLKYDSCHLLPWCRAPVSRTSVGS